MIPFFLCIVGACFINSPIGLGCILAAVIYVCAR